MTTTSPRTFEDRLDVLTTAVLHGDDAAEAIRSALGTTDRGYATDTAMIRDLFAALNQGRARFTHTPSGVTGANVLGREVISVFNDALEAGAPLLSDLNGGVTPALWLRSLLWVLIVQNIREEQLADQRAGFGCAATWGE